MTYNNLYPEQYGLLCCNVIEFRKNPTFRSNLSPPSPGSKRKPRKKPSRKLSSRRLILLLSSLVYSSTQMMGATCSSETSGCLWTTWNYNPVFIQLLKEHNSHNYDMFLSSERIITECCQRETDYEVQTKRDGRNGYFHLQLFLKTCFLSVSQKCPVNISQNEGGTKDGDWCDKEANSSIILITGIVWQPG